MAVKLTSSRDRSITFVRALLYGETGRGKTTSLATLPEKNTLVILTERSAVPLRNNDYLTVRVESWADMQDVCRLIVESTKDGKITIEGREIKCVALDSITELSDLLKQQIVGKDRKALISKRSGGEANAPSNIYDEQMGMEDWGLYQTRLKALVSYLGKIQAHLIVTAREQSRENRKTGVPQVHPMVNGALAAELPAYFDLVMRAVTETDAEDNTAYFWQTTNDGNAVAKGINGVTEPRELQDWTAIISRIYAKK